MARTNAANERLKRQYFTYLREARGRNGASIDNVAQALSRFEQSTGYLDFKRFHREQAIGFKRKINAEINPKTGKPLSRSTVHSTLQALRAFFTWVADRPGFRRSLSYADAEYFNLSEKDARIAKATREKPAPTIEQIQHVIAHMPSTADTERRDRALMAFTLLTGTRDGALASLKLKHVDIQARRVDQDAREVKTKFSKTFSTWFFPVGGEAVAIVEDWVAHLRGTLLWGNDDPLFPATLMRQAENGNFVVAGLDRKHWSNAHPIRRIFSEAFRNAGVASFNPHSLRDTLVRLGEQLCRTPEEFKAWSQNLGHEKVLTTFTSYGDVSRARQAELIANLGKEKEADPLESVRSDIAWLKARLPDRQALVESN